MTLDTILAALKAERGKVAKAIAALEEGTATATPAPGTAAPSRRRTHRKMSAEARQRLSEFKKKWWAKRKRKSK